MKTLLQLNTSLFAAGGQSSQLADKFVATWKANNADANVIVRDLASNPLPHLDAEHFLAYIAKPEERTARQQELAAAADALIEEIKATDVIVLGLPMYNFGAPSTLKAYFDHVARAGITFRYTEHGPQGLLSGKKAYVVATRGGRHAGTAFDTQSAFVRHFLGFIGITEVEFIYAEGLNLGDDSKAAGLAEAHVALTRLAA